MNAFDRWKERRRKQLKSGEYFEFPLTFDIFDMDANHNISNNNNSHLSRYGGNTASLATGKLHRHTFVQVHIASAEALYNWNLASLT